MGLILEARSKCYTLNSAVFCLDNGVHFSCLGGTRISCVGSVEIGEEGLFGSTTIIDSDVIPTGYMTLDSQWIEQHVRSIQIGSHLWAGTNAFILKGAHLGDECVLGAGAVAYDKTFPDRSLLMGNPARKIGSTR